jgi:hypothetical protein
MTHEQLLKIAEKYDRILYPAAAPIKDGTRLQHVRWMCNEILKKRFLENMEKGCRWLGFIQGVLWMENIYTIDQMREHNG